MAPLYRIVIRHLLTFLGSILLLTITLFAAARFMYPTIYRLADNIALSKADSYFFVPIFEWRIVIVMVVFTELLHQFWKPKQIWLLVPFIALIFFIIGFTFVGIDEWYELQAREYSTLLKGLTQGLHLGLWAIFYWLLYKVSLRWFSENRSNFA